MSKLSQLALPYYPSRSKEYQKIWFRVHSKNPDYFFRGTRTKDDINKYNLKRYYKDPKKRSEKSLLRLQLFDILGATKCVRCGFTDIRTLQLDHKNGGGSKDKFAKYRGTKQLYRYYINHPEEAKEKYQILCANCNWIKRYENHEVPHQLPYELWVSST